MRLILACAMLYAPVTARRWYSFSATLTAWLPLRAMRGAAASCASKLRMIKDMLILSTLYQIAHNVARQRIKYDIIVSIDDELPAALIIYALLAIVGRCVVIVLLYARTSVLHCRDCASLLLDDISRHGAGRNEFHRGRRAFRRHEPLRAAHRIACVRSHELLALQSAQRPPLNKAAHGAAYSCLRPFMRRLFARHRPFICRSAGITADIAAPSRRS